MGEQVGKRPTGPAGAEREGAAASPFGDSVVAFCTPRCLPRCLIRGPARADRSGVVADLEAGDLAERREHKVKGVDLPWAKPRKPRPHRS